MQCSWSLSLLYSIFRRNKGCILAWNFSQAVHQGNYIRAFRLLQQFDELQECAIDSHINQIK